MHKRTTPRKRARTKDGMAVIKAVMAAGGTVTITGKGHLRVRGPAGIAIISSDPANNSMRQTLETIERYSGLKVSLNRSTRDAGQRTGDDDAEASDPAA